jgi:hypothetical protein
MRQENTGFNTPEQVEEMNRKARETIAESTKWLMETAEQLGYQTVQSVDELDLSEEQKKQVMYTKFALKENLPAGIGENFIHLRAKVGDEIDAKAIVKVSRTGYFAADVFSNNGLFHEGHAANHDFNTSELEGTLKRGVEVK